MKQGYGVYIWVSKNKYEGFWDQDLQHTGANGDATFTWENGDVYVGEYTKGKRTGKGKLTCEDGTCYEGTFVDGRKAGFDSAATDPTDEQAKNSDCSHTSTAAASSSSSSSTGITKSATMEVNSGPKPVQKPPWARAETLTSSEAPPPKPVRKWTPLGSKAKAANGSGEVSTPTPTTTFKKPFAAGKQNTMTPPPIVEETPAVKKPADTTSVTAAATPLDVEVTPSTGEQTPENPAWTRAETLEGPLDTPGAKASGGKKKPPPLGSKAKDGPNGFDQGGQPTTVVKKFMPLGSKAKDAVEGSFAGEATDGPKPTTVKRWGAPLGSKAAQ
eukprot:Selendium_serpulae@DN5917_c6_g2_i6.p1